MTEQTATGPTSGLRSFDSGDGRLACLGFLRALRG